jgi:hypothetical protein
MKIDTNPLRRKSINAENGACPKALVSIPIINKYQRR